MEDEMEKYRNGIEKRRGERRMKNDRRVYKSERPVMIDVPFIIGMVILGLIGIVLYCAGY